MLAGTLLFNVYQFAVLVNKVYIINTPLSQSCPAQPLVQTHSLFTQAAPFWQFFVHFPV